MRKFGGEVFKKSRNSKIRKKTNTVLSVRRVWSWGGTGEKERKKEIDQRHLNYPSEKESSGESKILICLDGGKDQNLGLGFKFPNHSLCVIKCQGCSI